MRRDAFVVNRVHRRPRAQPTRREIEESMRRLQIVLEPDGAERLERALAEESELADEDAEALSELDRVLVPAASGKKPVRVDIPALPSDVHDLGTLGGIAKLLCPD
jgi:hypothetical protein